MTFIEAYMEYAEEFTDSPAIVHHRIAMSIISTVVNRNVFMAQGHKKLHANLWTLIIAPSSFYRKSFSLSIGESIIRSMDSSLVFPSEFSQEKLVEILAVKGQGLMNFYEFKTLMGSLTKSYMAGTQGFLTEMFDCPDYYSRALKKTSANLTDIFLNIMAASTIDWFVSSLNNEDIAGGFLPRFLIVRVPQKDKIIAIQPPHSEQKREALLKILTEISSISGEISFGKEGRAHYVKWYEHFEMKCQRSIPILSPFYARLAEYAKKFAMIFCINRTSGSSLEISLQDTIDACTVAENYAKDMAIVVGEEMVFGVQEAEMKKIEKLIKSNDEGISRSDLIRASRFRSKNLDIILETLMDGNIIEMKEQIKAAETGQEFNYKVYRWVKTWVGN